MKMILQTPLLIVFGQTDAANLDKADNSQAKDDNAEAFVADSIDQNSKNRDDRQNNARKKRKERKE